MRHVTNIKKLLDDGQIGEAEEALDNLLELGPNNLEALKLKAMLYSSQGRFRDEEAIWLKIIEIDDEDPDAIGFLHKKQLEDREHYYFTDDLPGGGRRFLAYPRSRIQISMLGLVGCVAFLVMTRLSLSNPTLGSPLVILIAFGFLVVSPWLAIIYTFCCSLRTVSITRGGIEVTTLFRNFRFTWPELDKVSLTYADDPNSPDLRLVLVPKDAALGSIMIDMNDGTSSVRAKTHLISEIQSVYSHLTFERHGGLDLKDRKNHSF